MSSKITEQDLIDRGFKYEQYGHDLYLIKVFIHKILGEIKLVIDCDLTTISIEPIYSHPDYEKPLTHANLDLFIKFAEGKEIK